MRNSEDICHIALDTLQQLVLTRYIFDKFIIVHEIGAKLVSKWEQNMLHTKVSKFYVEKEYLL